MVNRLFRFLAVAATTVACCPEVSARQHAKPPEIVTRNCSGCHGLDGNAQLSYFPRLAGLSAAYTTKKISEFRTIGTPPADELAAWIVARRSMRHGLNSQEARINMVGVAHEISADEVKASAEWYASQKPGSRRAGNLASMDHGKDIFLHGVPAQGLLACQTCHGKQAEGKAGAPRLAGQNTAYLLNEMEKFKNGDRQHAPEMTMVAQKGDREQFHALASYLQAQ